jgi:hypothetical protein
MGQGDFPNPLTWQDSNGRTPPGQFNNVDPLSNFPQDADGRMWWGVNAATLGAGAITFIGNTSYLDGTCSLTWAVTDGSNDGSVPQLQYSINGGSTWTTAALSDTLQMGIIEISLANATGLMFKVVPFGGVSSPTAPLWYVAVAITRNLQPPVYDWESLGSAAGPESNGLNPEMYNPQVPDEPPYDDFATLQNRLIIALGFSAQQANPPPGLAGFVGEKLTESQNFLYRKYPNLRLRHFFRWKLIPGQRFYSLTDNDEMYNGGFVIDVNKPIEEAHAQDVRNVWYPLIEGIPPTLYTMVAKPWRPARFEIRSALEIYPAPDQTYWVWLKGHCGLSSFQNPTDLPSIDSELVFMYALAAAKAHYGQQDAAQIFKQSRDFLGELVAGTHGKNRYIPAALPVPPAIRPTLIHFDDTP